MRFKIVVILICALTFSCSQTNSDWENLIIDNSLKGWHIFQDDGTKSGWTVKNDMFIFDAKMSTENMLISDASLLSDKKYHNFEIKFDWKIEKGGNSGFMWGVDENSKYKFPYQTGPEIQIIDSSVYNKPEEVLISSSMVFITMYFPTGFIIYSLTLACVIIALVVKIVVATLTAFSKAVLVTFNGSITPILKKSPYFSVFTL